MGKVNKFLFMLIAMVAIMLVAVGIDRGTAFYSERKWEKERVVRYQEASAEVSEMQMTISELAQDQDAIAAFLKEHEAYFEDMEGARETIWSGEGADFEEENAGMSGNELRDEESDVSGNLLGTVSGNTVVDISGNQLGTLSEHGFYDVSGNQLWNLQDNALYDVFGNQLGTMSEHVLYDISGNQLVTVSGNDLYSISGNLLRNVFGSLYGAGAEIGDEPDSDSLTEDEKEGISDNSIEEDISDNSWEVMWSMKDASLQEKRKVRTSYIETVTQSKTDQQSIEESSIDFSKIKIACIGDSLTEATNLDGLEDYRQYSYPARLQEILGAERVTNLGIGGSSIGRYWDNAFVDRYKEIPEDTDLIIVYGGTNDGFCASEAEVGTLEEREKRTFYGDLDELLQGIRADYPNAFVVIATPLPNVLHDMLKKERDYLVPQATLVEAIKRMAKEYDVPVIDLYNSNILDSHDAAVIYNYMPDGVHCNQEGYEILARHFAAELIKIYEQKAAEEEADRETDSEA